MKLLVVLIAILTVTCKQCKHQAVDAQQRVPHAYKSIDTSIYAIIKFDKANSYYFDKDAKPSTVSLEEIEQIEALLDTTVASYNKKASEYEGKISNPKNYFKQIIVVVNSKGDKVVWVNCFCSEGDKSSTTDKSYWKKGIVLVMDGGSCYFNLKINLTKGTVYDFMVNGVA